MRLNFTGAEIEGVKTTQANAKYFFENNTPASDTVYVLASQTNIADYYTAQGSEVIISDKAQSVSDSEAQGVTETAQADIVTSTASLPKTKKIKG